MLDAADIRQAVSMDTVLAWYGFKPNRAGFIPCPFHGDTDPSLKVFPSGRGWHCFGCGLGSSVIDFVMHMEGLTFQDACKVITERAGLEGYTAKQVRYRRNLGKITLEQKKDAIRQQYFAARKILLQKHEDFTEDLVWACQNIAHLEYLMENLDEYKG